LQQKYRALSSPRIFAASASRDLDRKPISTARATLYTFSLPATPPPCMVTAGIVKYKVQMV
jgi:hypothetical protein